jgi:hypothetical protein
VRGRIAYLQERPRLVSDRSPFHKSVLPPALPAGLVTDPVRLSQPLSRFALRAGNQDSALVSLSTPRCGEGGLIQPLSAPVPRGVEHEGRAWLRARSTLYFRTNEFG